MQKTLLTLVALSTTIMAVELEYGTGTFSMEGGFIGLTGSLSTDIDAYSLVDRHSNLMSDFYYGYDFHLYDSEMMKQGQHTYNGIASGFNRFSPIDVPKMEHRVKGLDMNVHLGYDMIYRDQNNFFGVGVTMGASMPTIDSISMNKKLFEKTEEILEKTQTKIKTYKIGPSFTMQKSFNPYVSVYGTGSFTYQTGEVKNKFIDGKYSVDGTFQSYNVGLYFTPFTDDYKLGWLTLSPRLFATIGYRYSKWNVDKMAIDVCGCKMDSEMMDSLETKFGMDSSIGYFGVGLSF